MGFVTVPWNNDSTNFRIKFRNCGDDDTLSLLLDGTMEEVLSDIYSFDWILNRIDEQQIGIEGETRNDEN